MKKSPNTIDERQLTAWLLEGDVSIQYQVHRDLLATEKPRLRDRIATEGWGAQFLSYRKKEGHWGQHFYQPKWISTHYTILDLKNLAISQNGPFDSWNRWDSQQGLVLIWILYVIGNEAVKFQVVRHWFF